MARMGVVISVLIWAIVFSFLGPSRVLGVAQSQALAGGACDSMACVESSCFWRLGQQAQRWDNPTAKIAYAETAQGGWPAPVTPAQSTKRRDRCYTGDKECSAAVGSHPGTWGKATSCDGCTFDGNSDPIYHCVCQ